MKFTKRTHPFNTKWGLYAIEDPNYIVDCMRINEFRVYTDNNSIAHILMTEVHYNECNRIKRLDLDKPLPECDCSHLRRRLH